MMPAPLLIALIMWALEVFEVQTGWQHGIGEDLIVAVLGALTGIAAWWAGNNSTRSSGS
jgi:hypothetical protein